jgi:hypothetical protein
MERITEIFNKNGRAALVVVISLRDRAVVLRVPSPNAKVLPPKIVVDTYLELLTTAALPFEPVTAPPARVGRDVRTNAGAVAGGDEGGDATPSSVASIQEREPWTRMSLKTRQWDIEAVRQEITDDMMDGTAKGQVADHWMMVSFCDVTPSSE